MICVSQNNSISQLVFISTMIGKLLMAFYYLHFRDGIIPYKSEFEQAMIFKQNALLFTKYTGGGFIVIYFTDS